MELDELKNIWHKQDMKDNMQYSRSELLMILNNKMITFEQQIQARDRWEIGACILVIIIFGSFLYFAPSLLAQIGCGVIIFSAGFIWYKLKSAQNKLAGDINNPDHSLADHLELELSKVKVQKKLLKTVGLWYIAPICIGLSLFTAGSDWGELAKIIYMSAVVVLSVAIWGWNQRTIAKRFDPLIEELKQSRRFLED